MVGTLDKRLDQYKHRFTEGGRKKRLAGISSRAKPASSRYRSYGMQTASFDVIGG